MTLQKSAKPIGWRRESPAPPPSHNPPRSATKMVLLLRAASCPRRLLLAIALLRPPAAAACAHGWFAGIGRRRGPGSGTVRGAGREGEGKGRKERKALGAESAAPELPSGVGSCCPVHRVRSLAERSKSACASGGWLPCSLVSSGVLLGFVFWAFGTRLRRAARAAPRAAVCLV